MPGLSKALLSAVKPGSVARRATPLLLNKLQDPGCRTDPVSRVLRDETRASSFSAIASGRTALAAEG